MEIISWNIGHYDEPWRELIQSGADLALLQEAKAPPLDIAFHVEIDESVQWFTAGGNRPWCTAVVKLSNRVIVKPLKISTIENERPGYLSVSRTGTLSAAEVIFGSRDETITVASIYGAWECPLESTGGKWIYADASVHRLISDLSALIGQQNGHKIIAAGDLNILCGHGEGGSKYWKARYDSVFTRMESIGLSLIGPQAPDGGQQVNPWPKELPIDSKNVPTFRTKKNQAETAIRQLDFVFASRSLHSRLRMQALNRLDEWGPSDHCRIMINVTD